MFAELSINGRRAAYNGIVIVNVSAERVRVQLRPDVDNAHADHTAQCPSPLPPETFRDVTVGDEHAQSRRRISAGRDTV